MLDSPDAERSGRRVPDQVRDDGRLGADAQAEARHHLQDILGRTLERFANLGGRLPALEATAQGSDVSLGPALLDAHGASNSITPGQPVTFLWVSTEGRHASESCEAQKRGGRYYSRPDCSVGWG